MEAKMIYQNSFDDCGLTALKNLLAILFHDKKIYSQYFSNKCSDFLKMIECARDYNVELKGYEVDLEGLKKCKFPCIAATLLDGKEHFVVIKKIKRTSVCLIDSFLGERKISLDEFNKIFRGKILEVLEYKKPSLKRLHLFRFSELLIFFSLSLFELSGLFTVLIFLNRHNLLQIILFMALTFIIFLIKRIYSLKLMEAVDKRFLLPYYYQNKNKERFDKLVSLKAKKFKSISNFIFHLQSLIIITYLLSSQNIYYCFSILMDIGISLALYALINPLREKWFRQTLLSDQRINDECYDEEEFYSFYKMSRKNGNKYMLYDSIMQYLPYVLVFVFSLAYGALLKKFTTNDILLFLVYNSFIVFTIIQLLCLEKDYDFYGVDIGRINIESKLPLIDNLSLLGYTKNNKGG